LRTVCTNAVVESQTGNLTKSPTFPKPKKRSSMVSTQVLDLTNPLYTNGI
jgi:hypothetical protein